MLRKANLAVKESRDEAPLQIVLYNKRRGGRKSGVSELAEGKGLGHTQGAKPITNFIAVIMKDTRMAASMPILPRAHGRVPLKVRSERF